MVLGGEFVPPGDVDPPSWAVDVHTMSYAELVNAEIQQLSPDGPVRGMVRHISRCLSVCLLQNRKRKEDSA